MPKIFLMGPIEYMPIAEKRREETDRVVATVRGEGAFNYFLGFYTDEPLLNRFSAKTLYGLSKHNHGREDRIELPKMTGFAHFIEN